MKVIILAAGEGKRLGQLTSQNPKCLVELFGKSLLQRQIELFKQFDINDITIVKGYLEEKINISNVTYFLNNNFRETNMVETLFCAREKISDSVIVTYGDIIYEKKVLEKLLSSTDDISVIIDENWMEYWKIRFENPLDDAESLVLDNNGNITSIGQKIDNVENIDGLYIGLMKFQNRGTEFLKSFYDKCKLRARNGKNPLNPKVPFEKSYMTDLLHGMVNEGYKIKAIPVRNGWLELDSYDDFVKYQLMFKEKTISKFFNAYDS